jgi:hypothetical protein
LFLLLHIFSSFDFYICAWSKSRRIISFLVSTPLSALINHGSHEGDEEGRHEGRDEEGHEEGDEEGRSLNKLRASAMTACIS